MASNGPVEVELKLLLPKGARAALEQHPALREPRATAPEVREEHTAYYDSPRLGLAERGLSLRVRRYGGKRVQTLKSMRDGSGSDGGGDGARSRTVASSRGEWEWTVSEDAPDVSRVAETPFGAEIAAEADEAGLQPVFETSIQRTVRTIELDDGTRAEAVIDEGQVSAGEATQEVSELELELKGGTPGPLYRLALDLHGAVPFTIGAESKAQRGQRLRTGEAPRPVEDGPGPTLDADAPAAEAMRRIVGAELGHMLANQPAAAAGDVEGVHQMRVGIRRLRTALVLFGKHLEPHTARRFETELKRLGRVFGAARDWDVFCTEILPEAEKDEAAKGWAALLREPAEAERQAAHRTVEEELGHPALTGLVLGMAAWVEPDGTGTLALGSGKLQRPLRKLAPAMLDRMARRAEKRGRDGGRVRRGRHSAGAAAAAAELHDLRKALKKLRYGAEYFAGLYPPKPVKQHRKATKRMLKLLGAGNDAAMAATLAERLCAEDGRSELAPAVGALAQWSEARRAKALRKMPKAWDALTAAPPFWR